MEIRNTCVLLNSFEYKNNFSLTTEIMHFLYITKRRIIRDIFIVQLFQKRHLLVFQSLFLFLFQRISFHSFDSHNVAAAVLIVIESIYQYQLLLFVDLLVYTMSFLFQHFHFM